MLNKTLKIVINENKLIESIDNIIYCDNIFKLHGLILWINKTKLDAKNRKFYIRQLDRIAKEEVDIKWKNKKPILTVKR